MPECTLMFALVLVELVEETARNSAGGTRPRSYAAAQNAAQWQKMRRINVRERRYVPRDDAGAIARCRTRGEQRAAGVCLPQAVESVRCRATAEYAWRYRASGQHASDVAARRVREAARSMSRRAFANR